MKNEVFNEIMEAEMIMTGLCDEELERYVTEDIVDEQNRSLLKRMSMLKQQIMTRRYGSHSLGDLDASIDSSSIINSVIEESRFSQTKTAMKIENDAKVE